MRGMIGASFGLFFAVVVAVFPDVVAAQGKMPFDQSDEVIYRGRSFHVAFSIYERETVAAAPDAGLPQKEWIEESVVSVRTNVAPYIGTDDEALARKVGTAFCLAYRLPIRKAPKDSWEHDGVWTFTNLCWMDGW